MWRALILIIVSRNESPLIAEILQHITNINDRRYSAMTVYTHSIVLEWLGRDGKSKNENRR